MFVILWRFRPAAGRGAEFECAYGPEGDWAALFRRSAEYLGTELLRAVDGSGEYLTMDRWTSRDAQESFQQRWAAEYAALDAALAALTVGEWKVGEFEAAAGKDAASGTEPLHQIP